MIYQEGLLVLYNKYKLYIFPSVVTLASLILIVFVIYPQTVKLISNHRTGEELLGKMRFLEVKAQELESINEEDLTKKLAAALTVFPQDKDFGNVIGLIQNISSRYSFDIVDLSLGQGSEPEKGAETGYLVKLEAVGPKSALNTLLVGLESAPRLMKVSGVEVSSEKSPDSVNVVITLKVLFSPVPNTLGALHSPLPVVTTKDQEILSRLVNNILTSQTTAVVAPTLGKQNPFE